MKALLLLCLLSLATSLPLFPEDVFESNPDPDQLEMIINGLADPDLDRSNFRYFFA